MEESQEPSTETRIVQSDNYIIDRRNVHWTKKKSKNMIGCPQVVEGDFYCSMIDLQSLLGAPKVVKGDFVCSHNKLHSLEGAPEEVGKRFSCNDNPLENLRGIPKADSYRLPEGFTIEDVKKELKRREFEKGLDPETVSTFGDFVDQL